MCTSCSESVAGSTSVALPLPRVRGLEGTELVRGRDEDVEVEAVDEALSLLEVCVFQAGRLTGAPGADLSDRV